MSFCDYHIHSNNSTDGHHSVMEICQRAVEAGLQEIAITDHFEPTENDQAYGEYNPIHHLFDTLKAKAAFRNRLRVKFGIEMGQPERYPEEAGRLLDTYPYDYVLASTHKLPGDVDMGDIDYVHADVKYYCRQYLRHLKELVKWNRFDCIGHLDLPKRYAAKCGITISFMDYREEVEEILKILVENGKGIEINTSGLRQHARTCLPDLDIVKLYKSLGGQVITIGSDAHYAGDVGKGIAKGLEIAKEAGFEYITVFDGRKPEWKRISQSASVYAVQKDYLKIACNS